MSATLPVPEEIKRAPSADLRGFFRWMLAVSSSLSLSLCVFVCVCVCVCVFLSFYLPGLVSCV